MSPKHPKLKKVGGRRTAAGDAPPSLVVHPLTGEVLERTDGGVSCWLDLMAGVGELPGDAKQRVAQVVVYRRDTLDRQHDIRARGDPEMVTDMRTVDDIFGRLDTGKPLLCVGCPQSIESSPEVAAVMIVTPCGATDTDFITGCLCNDCSSELITREALQQLIMRSFPSVTELRWLIKEAVHDRNR